jgi:hypothetical protein
MQLPLTVVFWVGPARTVFPVIEDKLGPDNESAQLKVTVTGDRFVHVPEVYGVLLGPAVAVPVTTGGVLSIRTGPNDSGAFVATFPALSVQLPLAPTPLAVVSCVNVCVPVGEPGTTPEFATGEALSTQV